LALQQFTGALQDAKDFQAGDTTKNNALVNFTNEKDVVDAFVAFTKEMQSLSAQERGAAASRVFGDRQINKLAEFFQIEDLAKRSKEVQGKQSFEQVGAAAEKTAQLEDLQAILKARRENDELIMKANATSRGTISAQDAEARAKLGRETQQLSEFQVFANLATQQERMATSIDAIKADVTSALLPAIEKIVSFLPMIVDGVKQGIEWLQKIVATVKKIKFWGS